MSEKPIERLNYFNGQRLQAGDFRVEQDYHIRVRRWLNRSLYEPGIAMGLEVHAVPGVPRVRVSPGLAIDAQGREIILLEDAEVPIAHDVQDSVSGTTATYPMGPYLVIRYNELSTSQQDGCCASDSKSGDKMVAGGPSRILAEPVLECVPYPPPDETSNKIVLGLVILAKDCGKVDRIDTTVRHYVGEASSAKVKQYALDGECEVAFIPKGSFPAPDTGQPANNDVAVVGRIYFHIRGRQPNAVTLYLRAEEFSPLRYTELGLHTHSATTVTGTIGDHTIQPSDLQHKHGLSEVLTDVEKADDTFSDGATTFAPHQHYVTGKISNLGGDSNQNLFAFSLFKDGWPAQVIDNDVDLKVLWGVHRHLLLGTDGAAPFTDTGAPSAPITLTHTVTNTGSVAPFGVSRIARSGPPLTFVDDLRVSIGPSGNTSERTLQIQQQLATANPADWADAAGNPRKLGDASGGVLKDKGTGPIRLNFLPGIEFSEGEYCIELSVPGTSNLPNGGRVHYNLYVE